MSWDATLHAACCGTQLPGQWNYTYNTTPMVCAAAEAVGIEFDGFQGSLDGMSGAESVLMMRAIIEELEANASRYEAMNPPNGWGSRTGIVGVMREMVEAAAIEMPTVWRVS